MALVGFLCFLLVLVAVMKIARLLDERLASLLDERRASEKTSTHPSDSENVDYDSMFTKEANRYAASGGKDPWPPRGSNLRRGPRGGWYTWKTTRGGRQYRRYR